MNKFLFPGIKVISISNTPIVAPTTVPQEECCGITTLNALTDKVQGFSVITTGSIGLIPNWSSTNGVHTLRIPMANTTGVTAGLISKAQFDSFTGASSLPNWGGITGDITTQTDLVTLVNAKVTANSSITGATKTKVTYDSKGLVTSGSDATTADIADSSNKRYVTDAQLVVIGNTSGTNSGDETTSTIKSKLGISVLSGSNTGDQDLSSYVTLTGSQALSNKTGLISQWTNDSGYKTSITSGDVTTALGYTPVTNVRTITINGTSQDLSANRSYSVGDALIANPLSQFASTLSSQLASIISDETGSGALVFGTTPVLDNPSIVKISTLSTYNGFVKSTNSDGTLAIDTSTYLTSISTLTIGTGLSGTSYNGTSGVTVAIDSTVTTLTGSQILTNKTLTSPKWTVGSDAVGDIRYLSNTDGTMSRLAIGSANQVLGVVNAGGSLEYKTISVGSTAVSNDCGVTLSTANSIVIQIPSASASNRGVITTGSQTIAGTKTFSGITNITKAVFAAGTTTIMPILLSSATPITTPVAGSLEFTTDDVFFTITTGTARKAFILDDGTRLTSGRVPYATTNGRLIDNANFTFDGTSLTASVITTGVTTNSNAASGKVGEYIESVVGVGSPVDLTVSGTVYNVTSISLTAGDWDVTGVVEFKAAAGTTTTYFMGGISTTTATLGGDGTFFSNPFSIATNLVDAAEVCPTVRLSLSGTTTVYLVSKCGFAISTIASYGTIRARRIR